MIMMMMMMASSESRPAANGQQKRSQRRRRPPMPSGASTATAAGATSAVAAAAAATDGQTATGARLASRSNSMAASESAEVVSGCGGGGGASKTFNHSSASSNAISNYGRRLSDASRSCRHSSASSSGGEIGNTTPNVPVAAPAAAAAAAAAGQRKKRASQNGLRERMSADCSEQARSGQRQQQQQWRQLCGSSHTVGLDCGQPVAGGSCAEQDGGGGHLSSGADLNCRHLIRSSAGIVRVESQQQQQQPQPLPRELEVEWAPVTRGKQQQQQHRSGLFKRVASSAIGGHNNRRLAGQVRTSLVATGNTRSWSPSSYLQQRQQPIKAVSQSLLNSRIAKTIRHLVAAGNNWRPRFNNNSPPPPPPPLEKQSLEREPDLRAINGNSSSSCSSGTKDEHERQRKPVSSHELRADRARKPRGLEAENLAERNHEKAVDNYNKDAREGDHCCSSKANSVSHSRAAPASLSSARSNGKQATTFVNLRNSLSCEISSPSNHHHHHHTKLLATYSNNRQFEDNHGDGGGGGESSSRRRLTISMGSTDDGGSGTSRAFSRLATKIEPTIKGNDELERHPTGSSNLAESMIHATECGMTSTVDGRAAGANLAKNKYIIEDKALRKQQQQPQSRRASSRCNNNDNSTTTYCSSAGVVTDNNYDSSLSSVANKCNFEQSSSSSSSGSSSNSNTNMSRLVGSAGADCDSIEASRRRRQQQPAGGGLSSDCNNPSSHVHRQPPPPPTTTTMTRCVTVSAAAKAAAATAAATAIAAASADNNGGGGRPGKAVLLAGAAVDLLPAAGGDADGGGNGDGGHDNSPAMRKATGQQRQHHGALKERENWSMNIEFLLAVIGFAVDLGNVWRFPYICYTNGGGAFLIPYTIMFILGGLPIFYLEMSLGQYFSSGCLTVWRRVCPMAKGIGYAMCVLNFFTGLYYNTIISWAVFFFVESFTTVLPWTSCDNSWNSIDCKTIDQRQALRLALNTSSGGGGGGGDSLATIQPTLVEMGNQTAAAVNYSSPTKDYFEREVLQVHLSSGIDDLGSIRKPLAIYLAIVFICIYFAIWKGVRSTGKAVWITALLPYFVLIPLLIRGVFLEGAWLGIQYYLYPQWSKICDLNVWVEAAKQIYFSLGPGFGTLMALSSYNKFNHNCRRDALIAASVNYFASFISGLVIFAVLGYMATIQDVQIKDVATEGPGLVFQVYPEGLATMRFSAMWSVLFFMMVITLGIDSTFGGLESVITGLCDEYPRVLRAHRGIFIGILIVLIYFCSLPTTTYGGNYVINVLESYGTSLSLLFIVLSETIIVCWLYGVDRFCGNLEEMYGERPGAYWRLCWKYISPSILLVIFLAACKQELYKYHTLTLGEYSYPWWAPLVGLLMTGASVCCIPIYAIYYVKTKTSGTLWERLKIASRPIEGDQRSGKDVLGDATTDKISDENNDIHLNVVI